MSVPTLTGMTSINAADSTTGWSGWGQNSGKWGTSSEFVKEGSASIALRPQNTGDGGYGYAPTTASWDLGSNLLVVWVYIAADSFVNTFGSTPAGVYIRLTSSITSWTSNYSDYYVGGSDIAWVGRGWHLIVLDANRTRDRGSGTTTLSTIYRIGVGFNVTATASKSDVIAIDAMYYGNTLEVTGPSFTDGTNGIDINSGGTIDRNDAGSFITDGWEVGDFVKIKGSATSANDGVYEITTVAAGVLTTGETFTQDTANTTAQVFCSVTLEDIYQKDGPTDDNWKGVVDKDPSGAYVINYPLTIGDVSGALDCFFLSRGESIVFGDQPMSTTGEDYFITAEDTGETHVLFGNSVGTGDSRTGFAGSVMVGQETIFSTGTPRGVDFDVNVTAFELYGSTFLTVDWDLTFASSTTAHYVTNTTFANCGQVSLGDVEARNLTFTGHDGTDAALLWQGSVTDIKNSQFLANSDPTNNPAGIEHENNTGSPYTYDGLTFAGNDNDIYLSHASQSITVNATNGADPSIKREGGTGTITINNTKTLKVTVVDEDGDAVGTAQTAIYQSSDDTELMNKDTDGTGVASVSDFNYSTDTDVYIRVRKSSTGTRYYSASATGTITINGLDVTITLREDDIVT